MSITHDYSTGSYGPQGWRAKAKDAVAATIRSANATAQDAVLALQAQTLHASDVMSSVGYGLLAIYAVAFVTRVALAY